MKPAQADLATIAALKTLEDVARAMGEPPLGLDGPFGVYIGVDDKHPDHYSVNLAPVRPRHARPRLLSAQRQGRRRHTRGLQEISRADADACGRKGCDGRAAAVFKLENEIAIGSWPAADRRDAEKTYNPMTIAELKKLAPQFPWDAYFASAGISENAPNGGRMVIVAEKSAFPKLAAVFAETPVSVWRDYLTVRYLHASAAYLPKAVDDADFAFYGKVLSGKTAQLDRQTRGMHLLDGAMGEALGKLYVAKYFPPEAKAKALLLVKNLLKAYEADIQTLSWMTPATRAKALDKLHHYMLKIGYPDHWRDYSALADRPRTIWSRRCQERHCVRMESPT